MKENKTKILQVRVTPTEAECVSGWARQSKMTLPDYLRKVVLRGITYRIEEDADGKTETDPNPS